MTSQRLVVLITLLLGPNLVLGQSQAATSRLHSPRSLTMAEEFSPLAEEAERIVDSITQGRAKAPAISQFTLADLQRAAIANNSTIQELRHHSIGRHGQESPIQDNTPLPSAVPNGQQLWSGDVCEPERSDEESRRRRHEMIAETIRLCLRVRAAYLSVLMTQHHLEAVEELSLVVGDVTDDGNNAAYATSKIDTGVNKVASIAALLNSSRRHYRDAWYELEQVVREADLKPRTLEGKERIANREVDYNQTLRKFLSKSPPWVRAMAKLERTFDELRLPDALGSEFSAVQVNLSEREQQAQNHSRKQLLANTLAELYQAATDVQQIELELQRKLTDKLIRLGEAEYQVHLFRNVAVPHAEQRRRIESERFARGDCDAATMLVVQGNQLSAVRGYMLALDDLSVAIDELARFPNEQEIEMAGKPAVDEKR